MDWTLSVSTPFTIWEFIARNWAMMSIIATLTAMVAIPTVVLGRYIRIMLNILKDTPPLVVMGASDFDRLEGQIVRFRAFDGTSLRGMFLTGDRAAGWKGMILFCHEFTSDMYSCARYCRPLLEAGFDVFSFDFRGHGESSDQEDYRPRQWASDREVDDVLGAVAFLEDYLESQGRPVELGVFGISRGAAAALVACARNPAVKAIVTDGLFSTDLTLETYMRKWARIFAKVRFVYENHPDAFWRFLRWVLFIFVHRQFRCRYPSVRKTLTKMLPRAMFMIHGERDSYIPQDQARFLFQLAPEPKSLWIVPTAKHNQSVAVAPAEYATKTIEFFERHLTGMKVTTVADDGLAQGA